MTVAACKSTKPVATVAKVRPISANRLIKNIEENAFTYEALDIKRIACVYESGNSKISFRATLTSRYNKDLLVSISKLNLPVARLYLTPDSVKMVNYLQKTWFAGDYSYLEKAIGTKIDFQTIQAILANDVFSYRDNDKEIDYHDYDSSTDSGMYVLQSMKSRKLDKIKRKNKEEKIDRYLKRTEEESFLVQTLFIDPITFKIRRFNLNDLTESRSVSVQFDEFTPIGEQLYPGSIDVLFKSPGNNLGLKVKLGKFSLDPNPEVNFRIPERYKRIDAAFDLGGDE